MSLRFRTTEEMLQRGVPVISTALSNSDTSMACPSPLRSRATSAPRIALHAIMAVLMFHDRRQRAHTLAVSVAIHGNDPLSTCAIGSKPSRSANAPSRP